LANKSETFSYFSKFAKKVQNEKCYVILSIITDNEGKFENQYFANFYDESGLQHVFSSPYALEQNGVVERKNKLLQEMAKTLLIESKISSQFWAEAVSTTHYIINGVFLRLILEKTPYEVYRGKKPNISYFHVFGSKCFILKNANDRFGKFEERSDE